MPPRLKGGLLDVLPTPLKVKYDAAQGHTWKSNWVAKLAWDFISPGTTAVFLVLTGLWYFYRMEKTQDAQARDALKDAALAFFLWGLFNSVLYLVLAWYQSP